jgi:hypothetical protein
MRNLLVSLNLTSHELVSEYLTPTIEKYANIMQRIPINIDSEVILLMSLNLTLVDGQTLTDKLIDVLASSLPVDAVGDDVAIIVVHVLCSFLLFLTREL